MKSQSMGSCFIKHVHGGGGVGFIPCNGSNVVWFIVHLDISVDEQGKPQTNNLHTMKNMMDYAPKNQQCPSVQLIIAHELHL